MEKKYAVGTDECIYKIVNDERKEISLEEQERYYFDKYTEALEYIEQNKHYLFHKEGDNQSDFYGVRTQKYEESFFSLYKFSSETNEYEYVREYHVDLK